jgi:hypothetical protein
MWPADYLPALKVIEAALTVRIEKAGAVLGSGSITYRATRAPNPGQAITLTVVPYNGPRQSIALTPREVLRNSGSLDRDTSAKIDALVAKFVGFRNNKGDYLEATDTRSPAVQRWRKERSPMYGDELRQD